MHVALLSSRPRSASPSSVPSIAVWAPPPMIRVVTSQAAHGMPLHACDSVNVVDTYVNGAASGKCDEKQ